MDPTETPHRRVSSEPNDRLQTVAFAMAGVALCVGVAVGLAWLLG